MPVECGKPRNHVSRVFPTDGSFTKSACNLPQVRNQRRNNPHTVIRREGRPRGDLLRLPHMFRSERGQSQMAHREGMVSMSRISPDGMVVESTCAGLKLFSRPDDQSSGWRHDVFSPPEARMAQQGNMHRKAKVVFGAAAGTDQINVISAQWIMTDQSVRIRRHSGEFRMCAGGKRSAAHEGSPKRCCGLEDTECYGD